MRILLISTFLSFLAYLTLWRLTPETFTGTARRLFLAAAALIHLSWFAAWGAGPLQGLGRTVDLVVTAAAVSWTVAMIICVVVGPPILLGRWVLRRHRPELVTAMAFDPTRRKLLAGALPVAAVSTGAGGTISGLQRFEVREEEIRLPGLPKALDGFRIGQLTDVHVGDFIDTEYLASAVEALNTAKVDLQVMTGDLIDDMDELDGTMKALERVTAPHGMLAILGNHEKWRDLDAILAAYAECAPRGRVKLLVDERVTIEHQGVPLHVVGVDYPMRRGGRHRLPPGERNAMMRASAEKAFSGLDSTETMLCLTHHPDFFPIAAERGAHLTLAGHTHGGQVGFLGWPLFSFAFEFMLGRYKRGHSHLYVSGGTGHWLPFRVGVPTEVTVLTLRAA